MQDRDINNLPSIPVTWLVSKKNGETVHTFFAPNMKADEMMRLVMEGHEDVREPFDNLRYVGSGDKIF